MNDKSADKLTGLRVLIVEDEMLLAMDLEALLEGRGCIVEAANSIPLALSAIEDWAPDVVTLDMNLDGNSSEPIAASLRKRDIPFVVVTGYSDSLAEVAEIKNAPLVKKPYDCGELIEKLSGVVPARL